MSYFLTQGLHRSLRHHPDRLASVFGTRRQTYRELARRTARLATALRKLGVEADDHVALLGFNSDRYIESLLACFWAGAVAVPLNTRWTAAEVQHALNDCDARVLLVDDSYLPMAQLLAANCHKLICVIHMGELATPPNVLPYEQLITLHEAGEDAHRCGDEVALLVYTGGTTGFPKGVMLSHMNLASASIAMSAAGCGSGDVMLHAVPSFHMAGLQMLFNHLFGGGTHVVAPRFEPQAVLEAIASERVTDLMLVPTMLQMLIEHPAVGNCDLHSLRRLFYGASPIADALLLRAMQALTEAEFIQGYGMTETCLTVMLPGHYHTQRRGHGEPHPAGLALPSADVRLVDSQDREVVNGVPGEIVVRGPMIMRGYWKNQQLTSEVLRDGWLHTGDIGVMNSGGLISIVDRLKDMIISGGENVYSTEVEDALAQHSAVALCAVIGVPHAKWGESVHAIVVLDNKAKAAVTEAELIAHCRGLMAGYKCPHRIEFRDSLPLSAAGKLLKGELRKPYWEGQDRRVT